MRLQPLHRGLGAAFLDARYAVDGVADQRQVIDDLLWPDAEFGHHGRHVEHLAAHRVHPQHVVVDQLREVLVASRDDGLPATRGRLHGERADHIIGLDALDHEQRPAQRAHRSVDRLDLRGEVLRHRRPMCLVLGEEVVAKGLALGVEHHRPVGTGVFTCQPPQHVDDAMQCAGRLAGTRTQVRQRVVGAVEVGRAVDEEEGGHNGVGRTVSPHYAALMAGHGDHSAVLG